MFPQPHTYGEWADGSPWFEGLSLRDYFAAKALAHIYTQDETKPDKVAEWAYVIADAMLKAREA